MQFQISQLLKFVFLFGDGRTGVQLLLGGLGLGLGTDEAVYIGLRCVEFQGRLVLLEQLAHTPHDYMK